MVKKRKSDASRLDEADRNLYDNFRSAANSLSLLYSQTVAQQRLSFQSGQHHALEKLYQWILRPREGLPVTTVDIVAYLQAELEHDAAVEATAPPITPLYNNNSQTFSQLPGIDARPSCNIPPSINDVFDQMPKDLIFPNALIDPDHQSLQSNCLTDNSSHHNLPGNLQSSNEARNQDQTDDCTDMQTDDPSQKSAYRFFKHE